MDQEIVQAHAQAFCDAVIAGDMERATEDVSEELRSNLGQLIALLPLPVTAASVESIDTGKSYAVVLRLVGESETVLLETRWKDRDGRPTIVEASHVVDHTAPAETAETSEAPEDSSE